MTQNFDLIVIHALQQPERNVAEYDTEHHTAAGFAQQQRGALLQSWRRATGQHAQKERKDHHSDAVIEERFTGDHQFQLLGRSR